MYRFLMFLLVMVMTVSCGTIFKGTAGVQAVGDMPGEAANVDSYKVRLLKTAAGIVVTPRQSFDQSDTLTLWFNYKQPGDNLPIGDLPYDGIIEKIFANTDLIWDGDNDANLGVWVTLEPGLWQCTVVAMNGFGEASSGRYDFEITGTTPVQLYLRGFFR